MSKYFQLLGVLWLLASCAADDPRALMVVEGNIAGLKKGTLYLQAIPDSVLVSLDSVTIDGDGNFKLQTRLSEPDIYYLYLESADNNELDDRIPFFGEPGPVRITSKWNAFESEARIEAGEIQKKFEEYRKNLSRFNLQELEQAREMAALQLPRDSAALDSLQRASERNLRRRYLYTINFALNNRGSYLAPYIAWTEVPDANPGLLDSVYRALPPEVAGSKYGKKLQGLLEKNP
jgi:hypothetical protein